MSWSAFTARAASASASALIFSMKPDFLSGRPNALRCFTGAAGSAVVPNVRCGGGAFPGAVVTTHSTGSVGGNGLSEMVWCTQSLLVSSIAQCRLPPTQWLGLSKK